MLIGDIWIPRRVIVGWVYYIHKMEIGTFASRMYAEGMPLEEISVYMGHGYTDTTKGYIYNYNEIEKNCVYMDKAL